MRVAIALPDTAGQLYAGKLRRSKFIENRSARAGSDSPLQLAAPCDVCTHGAESKNNYGFGKVRVK
jgi:hypothetical protein